MADITAAMVRELRDKSGAAMMDCKKALEATQGDIEGAFDELRKRGLKAAAKKEGRATGQGRLAAHLSEDGRKGAMVALACETDFVANTDDFNSFLSKLAAHAFEHAPADVATMLGQNWVDGGTVSDALQTLIGKLGENMQIADVAVYSGGDGQVGAYVHHDNMKGALVHVKTGADKAKAEEALKSLCMQIVVFSPLALDAKGVSADLIEREREIGRQGLEGKPAEIQEKILAGRMEKFFADNTLVGQPWIRDDKTTVAKAMVAALGAGSEVVAFRRFQLGA
ncbi:MAG: translation elongation factor Ts [Planctomycetota bacterium]